MQVCFSCRTGPAEGRSVEGFRCDRGQGAAAGAGGGGVFSGEALILGELLGIH